MAKIAVTDGMSDKATKLLESSGHSVTRKFIEEDDLLNGALAEFDAVIVRSATKLTKDVIEASKNGIKVIGRAGVGVDQVAKLCSSPAWIIRASRPLGARRWPLHAPTHAGLTLVMQSDVRVEEVLGA